MAPLAAWLPVLDRLAEHHQVTAIDLPGFGESPEPPGGTPDDMPTVVARVAEFFAANALDRPHVAGYSLGGTIALELAGAELVHTATLFCPAGFFTPAERRRALLILKTLRASSFLPTPVIGLAMPLDATRALCYAPLVAHPRRIDPQRAVGDALALRHGRGFATVARASRGYRFDGSPQVPVAVGWGTRDRILPPNQAERARERLPTAHHVLMPDCGHVPMSDDPELVTTLILETTGVIRPTDRPRPPEPGRSQLQKLALSDDNSKTLQSNELQSTVIPPAREGTLPGPRQFTLRPRFDVTCDGDGLVGHADVAPSSTQAGQPARAHGTLG